MEGVNMISISLCMIVKNESDVLARCLDSVYGAVDEIVIVDTGSEDNTKQIASEYTDKIFDLKWQDDFSYARNYAFEKGTKDYLLWLDADDVLPLESMEKLRELKKSLASNTDIVMFPYHTAFDENDICTFFYWRERLIRKESNLKFKGRVHEAIELNGKVSHENIPILHKKLKEAESERNLHIYEKMEAENIDFEPRELYYYGRELLFHGHLKKAEYILEKFLLCPNGWIENKIDASRQLATVKKELNDEKGELKALLQTLEYDIPRGETCCMLGRYFFDRNLYEQAYYWYIQALNAKQAKLLGAFIYEDCYGYIPSIMLCVCCDRMGKTKEAYNWNEQAGQYKPYSDAYLQNKEYFKNMNVC